MVLNETNWADNLKEVYTEKEIKKLAERHSAFMAMVPKNTKAGGKYDVIPVQYAHPGGAGATLSAARTNATDGGYDAFHVTANKKLFAVAIIDRYLLNAAGGGDKSFERATFQIDSAVQASGQQIARQLYGDESGAVSRVSSDTSLGSTTMVLTDKTKAANFKEGDVLTLAASNTSGSTRTGTVTVASINRSAGTVVMSAAITDGIASAAVSDYVFFVGDQPSATAINTDVAIAGLGSWIPDTAPSTTFKAVDRSTDPELLGGYRINSSGDVEEDVLSLESLIMSYGGQPDTLFLHPEKFKLLSRTASDHQRYDSKDVVTKAGLGFKSFELSQSGVRVVRDSYCPIDRGYMLKLNSWKLHSTGGAAPHIKGINDPGQMWIDAVDADQYEVRIISYAELACNSPKDNGVLLFSS